MDEIKRAAAGLVEKMTLEEKTSLLSGFDFWRLKGVERLGIPMIAVSDGPHGLRKQPYGKDQLGINGSSPATCFPTAATTACSFDRALLGEIGRAIGEECCEEDIAVILGPGLNIKRSPLCGRNFEYFSEDPCLAGELAAAYTAGVQSMNVGVSCKHFALNSQETRRMSENSVCDERAMREIYLAGFERAVKEGRPWTVMSSYNRVNGTYACENQKLLTDILRREWGFDGLVVSDWGGMDDRAAAVRAGNDLEMPGVTRENDMYVARSVRSGALEEEYVDAAARRVTELILKSMRRKKLADTMAAHHEIARRAAAESAVLLKNKGGILPGNAMQNAAVIGAFAKHPRYQGAGSSKINPKKLDCPFDALAAAGLNAVYAPGYDLDRDEADEALIAGACEVARGRDIVYVFAGLPDRYESEGFDRTTLALPKAHTELISRVAAVNPNTVVVLQGGGVMELPFEGKVPAILMCYLGGEAGAGAVADILLGIANPSGKLAETWPLRLEDNPSFAYFGGYPQTVEYRESIFVGYRYYDTAEIPVRYPFGFGLSYTAFRYSNPAVSGSAEDGFTFTLDITNTGDKQGAETVQLYVKAPENCVYKPSHELRGFAKTKKLLPGEKQTVSIPLTARDFAFYDTGIGAWRIAPGEYVIEAAASSRDIRLTKRVSLEDSAQGIPLPDMREEASCYYELSHGIADVPDAAFEKIYGAPIPPRYREKGAPHTRNSTFEDIRDRPLGRVIYSLVVSLSVKLAGNDAEMRRMVEGSVREMPLRGVFMSGIRGLTFKRLDGVIRLINAGRARTKA